MSDTLPALGLGIGWRPAVASLVLDRADLGFVEILVEAHPPHRPLPRTLVELLRRGLTVVPHGVGLSLGGADPPDPDRLDRLATLAERVAAPLVSEHVAFVRGGGLESGHLLPVPRTRVALEILVENVRAARERLPVPLALEPIATLFEWPDAELSESAFLGELLDRTGTLLLLDVANLHANARNHGFDARRFLEELPLERIAYVHVAGGLERGGRYHDTHAHPLRDPVLGLLEALSALEPLPGVMLERDDNFPVPTELHDELDAIRGAARFATTGPPVTPPSRGERLPGRDGAPYPGVPPDARRALAEEQAALVRSLLDDRPVPHGFEPIGFDAARRSLRAKHDRWHHRRPRRRHRLSRPWRG
jgi:uncharacterized protein